jgi:hypothetical protein
VNEKRGRCNRNGGTLLGRQQRVGVRRHGRTSTEDWRLASVVEQTFGVWLGLGAVKQKTAPPAAGVVELRET